MYFKESPFGISGVVFNGIPYMYDKESLTKCGGIYEPVFEIKTDKNFISKCFLAEGDVKEMFDGAPQKYVSDFQEVLSNIDFNLPTTVDK
jgi:hypothetical protein